MTSCLFVVGFSQVIPFRRAWPAFLILYAFPHTHLLSDHPDSDILAADHRFSLTAWDPYSETAPECAARPLTSLRQPSHLGTPKAWPESFSVDYQIIVDYLID